MFNLFKKKKFSEEELFACLKKDGIELTDEEITKAKNKDGETLYAIGNKYSKNDYKRIAWYRLAAAQNYSEAQYRIGVMYYIGAGVSENNRKSMDWLLKAANNDGNKKAQHDIGTRYEIGIGVPKNIHTAIEWFTKAANQGYIPSQDRLGHIYLLEKEVKDSQQAVNWFKKAADNGDKSAENWVTHLSEQGFYPKDEVKVTMSEEVASVNQDTVNQNDINEAINHTETKETTQDEQSSSTNDNTEADTESIKDRLRNLEETLQLESNTGDQNRIEPEAPELERNTTAEQVKSENEYLKEKLEQLEQEKAKMQAERKEKDEEIKQLKEVLERQKVTVDDDDANNDLNYDSSDDNSNNDNDSVNSEDYDTECDNRNSDDNHENDINYDSSDSEDRSKDLNYD